MPRPDRTRNPYPLALARWLLPALLSVACGAWADDIHWIDVRSPAEYADGHLSAAVNIPYTEITQRIDEVTGNRDAQIYLYCRSGRRSGIALDALEQAGYTNVVNAGGLEDARRVEARLETCRKEGGVDC